MLNIYRAKGRDTGLVFLFKYDFKGNLKAFEITDGELNAVQMKWLFAQANFPSEESIMKTVWMKNPELVKRFEITVSPADTSFEALWNLYDYKVSRQDSEKQFNKLKEADVIKCFISVPHYKAHQQRKGLAQSHLSTFLNKKYYLDDWQRA